jgi:septum formation protein
MTPELVLASRSPQRRQILEMVGVRFRVEAPNVDELTHGEPRSVVVENARRKARAVDGELVLACDTEVVLDGHVFGKAADAAEAETYLRRLSGRAHEVWGGLVLRHNGEERTAHACTKVRFRRLEQSDIDSYLDTGEWRDRAGAYAIQGRGAVLVEAIEGDYWNVVGLPLAELVKLAPELVRISG